jgi:acyl carrier protein
MTIKETIYEIISRRMKLPLEELDGSANLKKDYGADSIDTVEILFEVEEIYKKDVPDEMAETINSIDDLIAVVETLVNS